MKDLLALFIPEQMKQYMEMRKMMQRMKKSGGKRRGLLNRLPVPFQ